MLDNVEKWLKYVDSDMRLAGDLLEMKLKYAQQKKSYEEFLKEKFIPEAKSHGFDFSVEEFNSFVKRCGSRELTMEELEDVSGGKLSVFAHVGLGIFSLSLLSAVPTMITHAEDGPPTYNVEYSTSSAQAAEEGLDDVQGVRSTSGSNRASDDTSVGGVATEDETVGETANDDSSFLEKKSELEKLRHQIFDDDSDDDSIVSSTPEMDRDLDDEVEVSQPEYYADEETEDANVSTADFEGLRSKAPGVSDDMLVVSSTPTDDMDSSDDETGDMSDGEDKTLKQEKLSENQSEMAKMFCHNLRDSFESADAKEFNDMINRVEKCIEKEPALVVAPKGKALLIGDLHGNILSAMKFVLAARLALERNEVSSVVFLGDYVDRGENSIEVLFSLFKFKLDFPDRVFLIRGNHETEAVDPMDLPAYLVKEYGVEYGIYFTGRLYNVLFQKLPLAVEIPLQNGEKFLCVHGGIPIVDEDVSFDDVKLVMEEMRSKNGSLLWKDYGDVLLQILWNDPLSVENMNIKSSRRRFSEEQLIRFLGEFGYKSLVRGHEATDHIRNDYDGKCYTVFSSNDYCYMQNKACMAIATDGELQDYMNVLADESDVFMQRELSEDINIALFRFFSLFDCDDLYMNLALGYCYINGKGTAVDVDKGMMIYRKLAERGCADAQCELASVLQDIVVEEYKTRLQNPRLSEEERAALNKKIANTTREYLNFYKLAADQGHNVAQYKLGYYFFYREKYDEAAQWFRLIADVDKNARRYLEMCKIFSMTD